MAFQAYPPVSQVQPFKTGDRVRVTTTNSIGQIIGYVATLKELNYIVLLGHETREMACKHLVSIRSIPREPQACAGLSVAFSPKT